MKNRKKKEKEEEFTTENTEVHRGHGELGEKTRGRQEEEHGQECLCHRLGEVEAAGGEGVNAGGAGSEADTGRGENLDGAFGRDGYFGLNDVFVPIAGAGGNVAGQGKVRERGHGDVVGAADA